MIRSAGDVGIRPDCQAAAIERPGLRHCRGHLERVNHRSVIQTIATSNHRPGAMSRSDRRKSSSERANWKSPEAVQCHSQTRSRERPGGAGRQFLGHGWNRPVPNRKPDGIAKSVRNGGSCLIQCFRETTEGDPHRRLSLTAPMTGRFNEVQIHRVVSERTPRNDHCNVGDDENMRLRGCNLSNAIPCSGRCSGRASDLDRL